jgi:hypothetical protein
MRKLIGVFGLLAFTTLFAFDSNEANAFDPDCTSAFDTCDAIAAGVGFSVDMTHEEEYNYFVRCMEYYGCA